MRFIFRILYRFYRLFSWFQYVTMRRFTPAGMLLIIAIVASGMMGLDTDNTVTYQAFPPLFFLLLIAFVFSWFFRAEFSVTRLLPRFASVGHAFSYHVRVKNLSDKTQAGLTLLENLADPRPPFDEWLVSQLADERHFRSFRLNQVAGSTGFRQAWVRL